MIRAFLLLALLAACGAPVDAAPEALPVEVDAPVVEAESESCGMVFSPVPELADATVAAAVRWSVATGCDVRVGEGGVPVLTTEAIPAPAGVPEGVVAGGGTDRYEDGSCAQIRMVTEHATEDRVAHEFGHCLGKPGHLPDGIMSAYAKGPINGPALDVVCSVFPCSAYVPEG